MSEILLSLSRLQDWRNLVDIALVSVIFDVLLQLFRGTQAVQLLRGILVIALIAAIINQMVQLTAFKWLLANSAAVVLVAIPVIFQPELRRALERVGRSAPLLMRRSDDAVSQRVINEVIIAVEQMSERRTGALIVFEGTTGLGEFISRGVPLDAEVTSELLTTVFFPNTAAAATVIIAAGTHRRQPSCVLPLTQRELSDSQLGTRHRARRRDRTGGCTVGCGLGGDGQHLCGPQRTSTTDSGRLRTLLSDFYRP